jgi:ATP-dependent exoDNAse (exonuclease V) beta subunit
VVAPVVLIDRLVSVLAGDPALDVGRAAVDGLGHAVTVMTPEAAKGLEFDAVVVVEANDIAAERSDRAAGLRLLYVALTRPTQHLSVIGSTAVPELAAA